MVEQVTLALGRGGHHYLDYKGDQLPW
jgi:hypothetical protein